MNACDKDSTEGVHSTEQCESGENLTAPHLRTTRARHKALHKPGPLVPWSFGLAPLVPGPFIPSSFGPLALVLWSLVLVLVCWPLGPLVKHARFADRMFTQNIALLLLSFPGRLFFHSLPTCFFGIFLNPINYFSIDAITSFVIPHPTTDEGHVCYSFHCSRC